MSLPAGMSVERLDRRKSLLDQLGSRSDELTARAAEAKDPFAEQVDRACTLLLSGKVARAFDLTREDPRLRDRYGRHMYGQSLLMARRLVEAGVPVVQVNMGRVQTWDTHSANFKSLKNRLLPPTDQGVAALLDDLEARGMLDETMVVVTGEFGRTPRIGASTGNANTRDGRDHWAAVFSAAFAGGGVRGGQTVGQSDKMGAIRPVAPTPPPTWPRPSIARSASTRPSSCAIDSTGQSGCATARKSHRYLPAEISGHQGGEPTR